MMIRTGLIGYGLAGESFHAPLIDAVEGLALTAIASSRQEAIHQQRPHVRIASPEALIDAPDIDLIVIATPNTTHAPLASAALAAGKHVVIDKPLALSAAAGSDLARRAEESGRTLAVFHNRRWDGDFLTVRRLLDERALGEIRLFEAKWDRFRPAIKAGWRERPEPGSGLLNDLGPHVIDQALTLFGMPEGITADIQIQRDEAAVDDYFEIVLHYPRVQAVLSASSLIAATRPRFAVHGTAGSFVKYGLDPQEAWMRSGRLPTDPGYGQDASESWGVVTDAAGVGVAVPTEPGDYRTFYEQLVPSISEGAPPPVPAAAGVAVLKLIELARRSSDERRRLVVGD